MGRKAPEAKAVRGSEQEKRDTLRATLALRMKEDLLMNDEERINRKQQNQVTRFDANSGYVFLPPFQYLTNRL